jgi:hypothetical protein
MNAKTSHQTISLKLSNSQIKWLTNTAHFIRNETGCEVNRESIMFRLMEKGLPEFERELTKLRAKANANLRRYPDLKLAYCKTRGSGT